MSRIRNLLGYDLSIIQTRILQFSNDGRLIETVYKAKIPGSNLPEVTGRTELEAVSNLLSRINNRVRDRVDTEPRSTR